MALLANPQAFPVIAADSVRLMDLGAIGDQMAEDLEYLQPPVMQQARQQKHRGAPDPRQLQQEIAQLKEQLQHAEQAMEQEHQAAAGKQAELDTKVHIAQLEIASKEKIAALDRETKISVAELSAKVARLELYYEERGRIGAHLEDRASQAADQLHEHVQSELDRQHAVGMAAAGAAAAADQQQVGHEQKLAQGQQAADLAPAPNPAAGA